jgi:hypothetical protein
MIHININFSIINISISFFNVILLKHWENNNLNEDDDKKDDVEDDDYDEQQEQYKNSKEVNMKNKRMIFIRTNI